VSVTALAAAGAHLILFTTGRGTPFGGPVPTLKISTTTELAESKPGWIDFDAGVLLNGARMSDVRDALLDTVLAVASGQRLAANEQNGYREIAIFKHGVTL
jgi:altronate hydrolase